MYIYNWKIKKIINSTNLISTHNSYKNIIYIIIFYKRENVPRALKKNYDYIGNNCIFDHNISHQVTNE